MNKRLTWQNADTNEKIRRIVDLHVELEIADFRAKSMIEYHEKRKDDVNEDLKELHNFMIDFYNDLVGEIKQRRINL